MPMRRLEIIPRPPWPLVLSLGIGIVLGNWFTGLASDPFVLIGSQGLGLPLYSFCQNSPRLNVLEVDAWKHFLDDGTLHPVALVPFARNELIQPDHFSPEIYRRKLASLSQTYAPQRDVLMYFGGLPRTGPDGQIQYRHGLNFNAWTIDDLLRLRTFGGRPFIGLETFDRRPMEWMAGRLAQAGFGPLDRIYV